MIIKLIPQRRDGDMVVVKKGSTLVIDGEEFDFSPMQEGSTLPGDAVQCPWIWPEVIMESGEIILSLIFPVPANFSHEQAFPKDLINVQDGQIEFPKSNPLPENA
ncbi:MULTISPECIES: hypothetical protein [Pseudomonas syringae group]|uniref:Putative tail protein n=1 Tax=Pseudomonas phage MR15 TaxID=2711179 RepID=A0A6M3TDZ2_9CAUD|nr:MULTISPECIES: hypothetical protein [Pseudomonas syringae group]YP_010773124.1 putative tail protein [Pseudomonas phage MR15]QJD55074.1 putative tail protein [Pseudomonas phage MR13]KPB64238.1 Uncharacterized protein AC510_3469 [Pseudomonas amygdali pv. myricae]OSN39575.1 hypothetical protein BV342_01286 [Pseudomonas syringae pv. actinidiae]OSR62578.1 hypothetical protein BV325_01616 [Pseudomonas syringae pv. actinidiae]OSR79905.1 hypothetical protein BV328_01602 [Pseudomonas syringae pv. a